MPRRIRFAPWACDGIGQQGGAWGRLRNLETCRLGRSCGRWGGLAWVPDVGGMIVPLTVNPVPNIILAHTVGVSHFANQVANQEPVVFVRVIGRLMNVADDMPVSLKHD